MWMAAEDSDGFSRRVGGRRIWRSGRQERSTSAHHRLLHGQREQVPADTCLGSSFLCRVVRYICLSFCQCHRQVSTQGHPSVFDQSDVRHPAPDPQLPGIPGTHANHVHTGQTGRWVPPRIMIDRFYTDKIISVTVTSGCLLSQHEFHSMKVDRVAALCNIWSRL